MQTTLPQTTFQTRAPRDRRSRRRTVRIVKRGLLIVAVAGLVAVLALALRPKPVPVDFASVELGPLVETVEEDGVTRVKDRYVVSAPLTGNLARIELDPGAVIKQGTALARMVPVTPALLDERTRASAEARLSAASTAARLARAQVTRSEAQREYVKKSAERERALASSGSVARQVLDQLELSERTAVSDLEASKLAVRVADYEAQMARAALGILSGKGKDEQLVIPSPLDGRVLRVLHESEGVVQAGTPLVEVGDPRALEIVVDVLTSDAVKVRSGAEASIVEWGGEPLAARVRHVEPSAFTRLSALGVEEQRINVVLDVVAPRERWTALGDGYRVKAAIVTRHTDRALLIPSSAVFRREAGWAVFREAGGVARLCRVELGLRTARTVEVTSGIDKGDRVVLHPSDRVSDGAKIAAR